MVAATAPTRSEKADAGTVILYAAAALITIALTTALRVGSTFRETGIAWKVPIDQQRITASVDSGTISIDGFADEALIIASDVNAVSVVAIIAAITLWALAGIAVIAGVALVAWNFLRGCFFVRTNVWACNTVGWTLAGAPILIVLLETTGRNGVLSALGISDLEPAHLLEFWTVVPFLATGVTVGLIAVAFRRGIRLQQEKATLEKETEGLV